MNVHKHGRIVCLNISHTLYLPELKILADNLVFTSPSGDTIQLSSYPNRQQDLVLSLGRTVSSLRTEHKTIIFRMHICFILVRVMLLILRTNITEFSSTEQVFSYVRSHVVQGLVHKTVKMVALCLMICMGTGRFKGWD